MSRNEMIKEIQKDIENNDYIFNPKTGEIKETPNREPGYLWVTDIYNPVYDENDEYIGAMCGDYGFLPKKRFDDWLQI